MKILKSDSKGIAEALTVLSTGGVVAHATETCYGLACDMQNSEAIEKLFQIKKRPPTMPVSALFESVEQAMHFVQMGNLATELAHNNLPGPLTIVLPMKDGTALKQCPTPNAHTVGVRISSHEVAMKLVQEFGNPISTTSANIHGKPNPYSVKDIQEQYSNQDFVPDLILDSGTLEVRDASTVIQVINDSVEVLRRGSLQL